MKKLMMLVLTSLLFCLELAFPLPILANQTEDSQVLKVWMEAAYAPFNWTQNDDSNGAAPIEGTDQYANGYDVQIAQKVAAKLGKTLVVVKTKWDGLVPALTSGKIDMIIAGMSPTEERMKEIAFSTSYYTSEPVLVVSTKGSYAKAKAVTDFAKAKVTAQQGVWHVDLLEQLEGADPQTPMGDFSQMRQALEAGIIDAYISERPEALTAESANKTFKMVSLNPGFEVSPSDAAIAVGLRKDDERITLVNEAIAAISQEEQLALMDDMIAKQPFQAEEVQKPFWVQMMTIVTKNWKSLLTGTGMTLFIAITATLAGLTIGLLIGVFRTSPKAASPLLAGLQQVLNWLLSAYIEIFRGTPMIVQSMVIYYGSAQAFGIHINRIWAAIFIVSINTGAYMSEIVRGGIFAIDKGQFEAATALGMTHNQTMRRVILPQVIRNILPATGNEFVINIKDTSVLNVISVVELYFSGNTVATQTYQYFQTFTVIAIIYFVLTFTITRILRYVERRFDTDTYTTGANQMQIKELN